MYLKCFSFIQDFEDIWVSRLTPSSLPLGFHFLYISKMPFLFFLGFLRVKVVYYDFLGFFWGVLQTADMDLFAKVFYDFFCSFDHLFRERGIQVVYCTTVSQCFMYMFWSTYTHICHVFFFSGI